LKVRDLLNALDTLTAGRTQNLDLDVLVRASTNDDDDLLIASELTLRIEETCADEDTLFIDVSDEEQVAGEELGEAVRRDTIPIPPPVVERRHLRVVRSDE